MTRFLRVLPLAALLTAAPLAACGGDDEDETPVTSTPITTMTEDTGMTDSTGTTPGDASDNTGPATSGNDSSGSTGVDNGTGDDSGETGMTDAPAVATTGG